VGVVFELVVELVVIVTLLLGVDVDDDDDDVCVGVLVAGGMPLFSSTQYVSPGIRPEQSDFTVGL
jgi:hypothetical protein